MGPVTNPILEQGMPLTPPLAIYRRFFFTVLAWIFPFLLLLHPGFTSAELPGSEERPFWTQKSCYREGDLVFAVGLSMGRQTLEQARKESFQAALWELSNYAQIRDTSLFLVETQMTYEEQNPDGSYSVWRLVKIPFAMVAKARELLIRNTPSTRNTVHEIQKLEKEDREDLADALRRTLLQGEDVSAPPEKSAPADRTFPSARIHHQKDRYALDEGIVFTLEASDDTRLQSVHFTIGNSGFRKSWFPDAQRMDSQFSLPAAELGAGKKVYTLTATDSTGNTSQKNGVFYIDDRLHEELYEILSRDLN